MCIVFVEGSECNFDPDVIRSQFLHVYIVIHPEMIKGKEAWRIQVINKKNVSECSPLLPSPSIIYDENELRGFLMLKSTFFLSLFIYFLYKERKRGYALSVYNLVIDC